MFGLLALLLVVSPPHFGAAPGWHVGAGSSWGWASTVPYQDCQSCLPPHRTLARLPPGGILIQLDNGHESPPKAPLGKWPPRIRRKDLQRGGAEGIPRRDSYAQWLIRSGRIEHYLWVWFGRVHPSRRQLARANTELRTVR